MAETIYRQPDHPALLQTYISREYDLLPQLSVLNRFLHFWKKAGWQAAFGSSRGVQVDYASRTLACWRSFYVAVV
jgi:uncharacterized protein Usg